MSKVVYLRPPIVVKELASQLGLSPYRLIHDLLKMNDFINSINESIETEVAKFICEQYGYTLFTGE
jgi:translation initiation factor IF-2